MIVLSSKQTSPNEQGGKLVKHIGTLLKTTDGWVFSEQNKQTRLQKLQDGGLPPKAKVEAFILRPEGSNLEDTEPSRVYPLAHNWEVYPSRFILRGQGDRILVVFVTASIILPLFEEGVAFPGLSVAVSFFMRGYKTGKPLWSMSDDETTMIFERSPFTALLSILESQGMNLKDFSPGTSNAEKALENMVGYFNAELQTKPIRVMISISNRNGYQRIAFLDE